jgi:hypothetical protein
MRTRSSPATSKFRNPPGSSAGCHPRDWCRDTGRWARHQI